MSKMTASELTEKYQNYVMPTYAPNLLLVRGEGCNLWDIDNNRYLDFGAGICVCNLGHCHPAVAKAIAHQAATLVHTSNLYMNNMLPQYAAELMAHCFDGVAFFANSGAEANEGLIKFARKYGSATGRYEIIAMKDSFHGRTLATLAATGRSKYREGFAPDMPGFVHVEFNNLDAIKNAVTDKTIAVLLEPVQGEGGIIPADREYLSQLRQFCDEKDILLLFDEVQCGMGRIGTLFAFQSFGVEPDALSMAKGIANGFPMGAMLVQRKHAKVLTVGKHASTFGGTALACAAALATLQTFDRENVLDNCRAMGAYLMENLQAMAKEYDFIKKVRGMGLMIGVVLDHPAGDLQKLLLKYNLITLTAGETVLRLLPPLTITKKDADEALGIMRVALKEYAQVLKESKNV